MPLYPLGALHYRPRRLEVLQVKLKNRKFSPNAAVSWIVETEFVFAGQKNFFPTTILPRTLRRSRSRTSAARSMRRTSSASSSSSRPTTST
ncbi:hypothetical protein L596_030154 [Steinernema carpocapsae]|uniref:Uncharacterized protein n=1 Tax=Steinernema carpocapsae TaxID=34508 RepID=A0A4V5ZX81_STECR|nr:hypothetical protein L596_030154 [Steinernema carpocapsae]